MSGKVRCTEKAWSRCPYGAICEENAEVPEDSECGQFILDIAMKDGVDETEGQDGIQRER